MPSRKISRVGDVFNPYGLFNGIFLPEPLVGYRVISSSAKLLYARLTRYAGKDGKCYPSQPSLANELGVSERHVRNLLDELISDQLLKRFRRGFHKSNEYKFLRHPILEACLRGDDWKNLSSKERNRPSGSKRNRPSDPKRNPPSFEDKHDEDSHLEERQGNNPMSRIRSFGTDSKIDTRRKKGNPVQETLSSTGAGVQQTSEDRRRNPLDKIRSTLFREFGSLLGYPDAKIAEIILNSGMGAPPEHICKLISLYAERFRKGEKPAPRSYGFFRTHISRYFEGHPPKKDPFKSNQDREDDLTFV
ncbi:MAG: helix-turn-helix domain-containing protein [Bryobacteraceae bacterium]